MKFKAFSMNIVIFLQFGNLVETFCKDSFPLEAYAEIDSETKVEYKMKEVDQVTINFLLLASGITGHSEMTLLFDKSNALISF